MHVQQEKCQHGAPFPDAPLPAATKMAQLSCNGNPLIDGRGGRRRMRGSMDVVDAERLPENEVAIVRLGKRYIETWNGLPCNVYNSVPVVLYLKPFRTTGCTDRD
jgi:hypothetical protein